MVTNSIQAIYSEFRVSQIFAVIESGAVEAIQSTEALQEGTAFSKAQRDTHDDFASKASARVKYDLLCKIVAETRKFRRPEYLFKALRVVTHRVAFTATANTAPAHFILITETAPQHSSQQASSKPIRSDSSRCQTFMAVASKTPSGIRLSKNGKSRA